RSTVLKLRQSIAPDCRGPRRAVNTIRTGRDKNDAKVRSIYETCNCNATCADLTEVLEEQMRPRGREKTLLAAAAALVLSTGAASALNCFAPGTPGTRAAPFQTATYTVSKSVCPSGRMSVTTGLIDRTGARRAERSCRCI